MADLAAARMGGEFIPPDVLRDITAYYYGSSPEVLPALPHYRDGTGPLAYTPTPLGPAVNMPLVINIESVRLTGAGSPQLLVCDGGRNVVSLLEQRGDSWRETVLAEVQVPIRTQVIDYDGDGDSDIVVAALGLFPPSDKLTGKVLLLRRSGRGEFQKEVLLQDVGRVSDARALDLDSDGDLDLAVAIFGGGSVGELAWLENQGEEKLVKRSLLKGGGALNISPVDLNGDGMLDLVSLISQEHEMVVALINRGEGKFDHVSPARAPHPMFGFTGMELVDLDSDGDMDMLLTNGDAHDLQKDPKPYHGVQWLENRGDLKFQFHDIGRFYGTATATAGDMDADGDLDVVAGSWNNYWDDPQRQSLVWFENDGRQGFTRHNIHSRPPGIVSLLLEDVTGDGRLDILAGVFRMDMLDAQMAAGAGEGAIPSAATVDESLKARVLLFENAPAANRSLPSKQPPR